MDDITQIVCAEDIAIKMRGDIHEMQEIVQFFQRGGALRMLLGKDIRPELDMLFRYAKQLSEVGEYGAAARLFKVLTIYDGWSFDYWFELGACCQAEAAWVDAIYAYGRAAQIRVSAAIAPCAAGECYLACGNHPLAIKAFRAALLVCGNGHDGEQIENMEQADVRRRALAGLAKIGGEYEHE